MGYSASAALPLFIVAASYCSDIARPRRTLTQQIMRARRSELPTNDIQPTSLRAAADAERSTDFRPC